MPRCFLPVGGAARGRRGEGGAAREKAALSAKARALEPQRETTQKAPAGDESATARPRPTPTATAPTTRRGPPEPCAPGPGSRDPRLYLGTQGPARPPDRPRGL